MIQSAQDIEQGGFTAARRAQQHHYLTLVEFQIDAPQRMDLDLSHLINFNQINGLEDRH